MFLSVNRYFILLIPIDVLSTLMAKEQLFLINRLLERRSVIKIPFLLLLASCTVVVSPTTPDAQELDIPVDSTLTGDQLKAVFIGNTEVGRSLRSGKWVEYKEYFHPNGKIYGNDIDGSYKASWKIKGNTFCFRYHSDEKCYTYVKTGESTYTNYFNGTAKAEIREVIKGRAKW